MSEHLIAHFRKFVELKDEEASSILPYFQAIHVPKKQNILEEGDVCKSIFFVLKGCLRMFFVNDKGIEHTTQFAIEHWWISDYLAFHHQQNSAFFIQAVEHTDILVLSYSAQEALLKEFPQLERYFRLMYQKAYGAIQLRLKYHYDLSKEELYHQFNSSFPEFTQRIPQYLLASYLGFTPEYLSEIRKKNAS